MRVFVAECNAKAKRGRGRQRRYPSWRQGFKEELA